MSKYSNFLLVRKDEVTGAELEDIVAWLRAEEHRRKENVQMVLEQMETEDRQQLERRVKEHIETKDTHLTENQLKTVMYLVTKLRETPIVEAKHD